MASAALSPTRNGISRNSSDVTTTADMASPQVSTPKTPQVDASIESNASKLVDIHERSTRLADRLVEGEQDTAKIIDEIQHFLALKEHEFGDNVKLLLVAETNKVQLVPIY